MAAGDLPNWLVILAKAPRIGRAKTRLADDAGPVEAARFARQCLAGLVRRVGRDTRWHTLIAGTPRSALRDMAAAYGVPVMDQGAGDLGDRMQAIAEALPPGPVLIVGADVPEIRARHIARGFAELKGRDAVFGPSPDGGFWMAGLARRPRVMRPFGDVRWSSEHALKDCLENLQGYDVALTDSLADVDTGADLKDWKMRRGSPRVRAPGRRTGSAAG